MNKFQMNKVMGYLDAEYAGIVNKMTETDKKIRAEHWAKEIGPLNFDAVMRAVRKLAKNQYMPRTAEIISEVEKDQAANSKSNQIKCRIMTDAAGDEIVDLRHADGSEWIQGYLRNLPEWMQIKFRWLANPTPENTLAWDNVLLANGK